MSYKQAWDAVGAMNNLAERPLVQPQVGGRQGGGTQVTEDGRRLFTVYAAAEKEYRHFLARLCAGIQDFDHFRKLLGAMTMKVPHAILAVDD